MNIKNFKYIFILSSGATIFLNKNYNIHEQFLFSEKDNNTFFLNKKKKEGYKKFSNSFLHFRNKYFIK